MATSTTLRTHVCGELNASNVGAQVTLAGWVSRRREHGDKLAFIDLRDFSGVMQCVIDDGAEARSEWVVQITGTVTARPTGTVNTNLPTGEVELTNCSLTVLNAAEPPPFPIDQRADDVD
ncbi:MAG: aspartate--tRNA ligase, partial [Acidimicrobiaceae bacterium]|nr:aspartate--tRNA ligase [Acidimicrobiaceae bacterium]